MARPNDSAFPVPDPHDDTGLSVREHFAAMAMQGLVLLVRDDMCRISDEALARAARDSVRAADALLAALNEKT